ncbi:MAG: flagellar export chaperone FliS [Bacillota bacterium]
MTNPYQAYQTQQVTTATPPELTLQLYQGAVRFLKQAIQAHSEKNWTVVNERLQRVQDIYSELLITLKPEYEISQSLAQLYDFLIRHVREANVKKDVKKMEEALELAVELRDTWEQAMQKLKEGSAGL